MKVKVGDYVEVTEDNFGEVKAGRQGMITHVSDGELDIFFPDLTVDGEWDEEYADGWRVKPSQVKIIQEVRHA